MRPAVKAPRAGYARELEERRAARLVHGPEGATDMEATFALTEKTREPFERAIFAAKIPTQHSLTITPAP